VVSGEPLFQDFVLQGELAAESHQLGDLLLQRFALGELLSVNA
jgi:hypothetical protein